jgi:hypothetical protein
MCRFERPRDFPTPPHSGGGGLRRGSRVKTAVLLPLLVAYGLGFVVLYAAAQSSAARSVSERNDPMAFVGP